MYSNKSLGQHTCTYSQHIDVKCKYHICTRMVPELVPTRHWGKHAQKHTFIWMWTCTHDITEHDSSAQHQHEHASVQDYMMHRIKLTERGLGTLWVYDTHSVHAHTEAYACMHACRRHSFRCVTWAWFRWVYIWMCTHEEFVCTTFSPSAVKQTAW